MVKNGDTKLSILDPFSGPSPLVFIIISRDYVNNRYGYVARIVLFVYWAIAEQFYPLASRDS